VAVNSKKASYTISKLARNKEQNVRNQNVTFVKIKGRN
jgi:hypothetical protein